MIVICTKCKAKFRVADDRIGPRGAKVRCSRCRTVFHVLADAAPAPDGPTDVASHPIPPPRGMDVELENPFAAAGASAVAAPAEADPFAAAGLGIPIGPPPLPAPAHADPFAATEPAPDDPFARAASTDPFAAPPPDDFQPPSAPAPHAATDLADLIGSPSPPPLPPDVRPEPSLDIPHVDPPAPDDGGLALEERSPIVPAPVAARSLLEPEAAIAPAPTAGGFVMGGDPRAFESYDFGPPDPGPALALDTAGAPREAPRAAPPPLPAPAAPVVVPIAEPVHPPARTSAPSEGTEPTPSRERAPVLGSRFRAAIVNAFALAALLAVTLAFLVVWRSDRAFEGFSLRPSAILAALGRGGDAAPFTAVDVRSGEYEREQGPPILFVRGKVISRAPAAVRGVKVLVEVVRGDGVLARGEALAGAVPTPEELYQLGDGPGLAGLAEVVARRAPAQIRPGETVPFLVPIADAPTDLEGASVRVELAAAGAPRR